jgi:hypothetical protein
MKSIRILKGLAIAAATFGILLPHAAITHASETARANRQVETIRDLALGTGGTLNGQLVNKDGLPNRGATVSIIRDGNAIASVKTNDKGMFTFAGMSGGVYGISSGKATGVVRAWSHQTAPPAASKGILLVPSDLTVRGQNLLSGLSPAQIGLGGLLVLGVAGTIIAIVIDNADAS